MNHAHNIVNEVVIDWVTDRNGPAARKFWGIVGQDPSDSKFSQLHVDITSSVLHHSFEVYSIDPSKKIGISSAASNFNRLFLKLNRFICN